jgi:hypothetical protein
MRFIQGLTAVVCLLSTIPAHAETLFGLTMAGNLVTFSSTSPNMLLSTVKISGLAMGETLVGIDFRPATRELYGVGSSNQLYVINTFTGMAMTRGAALNIGLSGDFFGVDFNPQADRLRVVSNTTQNLRINPNTGAVATNISPAGDVALTFEDAMLGTPDIVGAAYSNNVKGASSTVMFVVDSTLDILGIQGPMPPANGPNQGVIRSAGSLKANILSNSGFDISGLTGIAYLASGNTLWTVDVKTFTGASLVGSIGVGSGENIVDITAAPVPEPASIALAASALAMGLLRLRRRVS